VPYHPVFYAPLALLHFGLALRVGGDASGIYPLTVWGGVLAALALLAFVLNTAAAVVRGLRSARRGDRGGAAGSTARR